MSKSQKVPPLETELIEQLAVLENRLEEVTQSVERTLESCASAIEVDDLHTARDQYRKAERQVNLIYNLLGMRQFKNINLSEPPTAPTVPKPPTVPVAPPTPAVTSVAAPAVIPEPPMVPAPTTVPEPELPMVPEVKPSWWRKLTGMGRTAAITGLLVVVTGCGVLTKYRTVKELDRVDSAKTALVENKQERTDKGRDFVYGTKEALNRVPDPGPEVKVAKVLNDRANLALGNPPAEEALKLQKMVEDLLSANAEIQKNGQAELARRESDIVKLEERYRALEEKLKKVEDVRDSKFIDNANKAAKWDQENSFLNSINPFHDLWKFVKKLFFLALFVGLLGVGLKVASMFFPALAPLSAVVDGVLGGVGRMIFRMAPRAKASAGVVSSEVHDLSEKTLATLIHAVQDIRYDNGPEIKSLADKALAFHNDEDTEAKIRQVKETERLTK